MEKRLKVLHFIDDDKFIPFCQKTFDVKGIENFFAKSTNIKEVQSSSFDVLVVHSLELIKIKTFDFSKLSQPIIWFFWGADAFRLGKFYSKFLMPKTKRLQVMLAFKRSLNSGLKTLIKTYAPQTLDFERNHKLIINTIDAIDIIVPVMPGDYFLLKKAYPIKASMLHLNYVNPIFDGDNLPQIEGTNILLGNSSSFTNNHKEIIDKLEKIEIGKRKVYIPLNYGDCDYGDYVEKLSKKKIGKRVVALRKFIPFNEYQKIINSCSIMIFNHLRQQALGNIVQGLYSGAHLYINRDTTTFQFLNENRIIFSTIDDLEELRELNQEEKDFNRKKCREVFGYEQQHKKVHELLKLAIAEK